MAVRAGHMRALCTYISWSVRCLSSSQSSVGSLSPASPRLPVPRSHCATSAHAPSHLTLPDPLQTKQTLRWLAPLSEKHERGTLP
eukprot:1281109-Rhodomonas_salina.1